jgi:replicative DNA helicase
MMQYPHPLDSASDPGLSLSQNKLLPHSTEAEQQVLGALFFDHDAITQIIDVLKPDDFYRGPHQHIFEAACELFRLGEQITVVTLSEWLSDQEALSAAGGRAYLMDLAMSVATAEAIRWHANIVKEYSIRRRLIHLCDEVSYEAYTKEGSKSLEFAQTELMHIAIDADGRAEQTTKEVATDALEEIVRELDSNSTVTGLQTGFPELDNYTRGLQPATFTVLAARPGMGKTGLAVNIAANVAIDQGLPVLYFSQEMPPKQMMRRLIVAMAESDRDRVKLADAAERVPDHLRFIRKPGMTIPQLRASIMRHKIEMGQLGLIIVDYLQQMRSPAKTLFEQVTDISGGLKDLALEFDIPLLVLSQLSREVEKRQDKRPVLSDLRQSGSIEQDADKVCFIYRDEYYNKQSDKPGIAEIIVAKNRQGSDGTAELLFRGPIVKFFNRPRGYPSSSESPY